MKPTKKSTILQMLASSFPIFIIVVTELSAIGNAMIDVERKIGDSAYEEMLILVFGALALGVWVILALIGSASTSIDRGLLKLTRAFPPGSHPEILWEYSFAEDKSTEQAVVEASLVAVNRLRSVA